MIARRRNTCADNNARRAQIISMFFSSDRATCSTSVAVRSAATLAPAMRSMPHTPRSTLSTLSTTTTTTTRRARTRASPTTMTMLMTTTMTTSSSWRGACDGRSCRRRGRPRCRRRRRYSLRPSTTARANVSRLCSTLSLQPMSLSSSSSLSPLSTLMLLLWT